MKNITDLIEEKQSYLVAQMESAKHEIEVLEAQKQKASSKGIEKWLGNEFESSSSVTEEYMAWKKDYRKEMKKMLPDNFEMLPKTSDAHFSASGFIRNKDTNKLVYWSISDIRYFQDTWYNNILIRTAEHDKDWTGGGNNYATWNNFTSKCKDLTQ
jgi:hypothetical protein